MLIERRRRRASAALAVALASALGLSPDSLPQSPLAAAEPDPRAYESARRALVADLERIASWAAENRLAGAKHRTLAIVLRLEPDHPNARIVLGYTRSRSGEWTRSPGYREPADWNKDALPVFDGHLREACVRFRNDALVAVEEGRAPEGEVLDLLVSLLPDDPMVRKARGEERVEGRWLPTDVVLAQARRTGLASLAARARARAEPVRSVRGTGVPGHPDGLRSGPVVVAGSADARILRAVADRCAAVPGFLSDLFSRDLDEREPVVAVVLRSADEARAVFTSLGAAADWKRVDALGVGAAWVGSTRTVVAFNGGDDATMRLAVRSVFQWFALGAFEHGGRGWISEGVERVLLFHLTGFPGPSTVANEYTGKGAPASGTTTIPSTGDLLPLSRATVLSSGPAELSALLTKRLSAMTPSDALLAYALASFVFEATPEKAKAFVASAATSDDAASTVRAVYGISVESLSLRLRRFVAAMVPEAPSPAK